MFEKIHSYQFREQIMAEMEDVNGELFLMPLSIHEKIWLKTLLKREESQFFLSNETIDKLLKHLGDMPTIPGGYIIEKRKPAMMNEDLQVYQFHKMVRDIISKQQAFTITYQTNDRQLHIEVEGVPFKLEFLAHKNQWYVLWLQLEMNEKEILYTPLRQIRAVESLEIKTGLFNMLDDEFDTFIHQEKQQAVIILNHKVFHEHSIDEEKQRIFYALSSFEKEVFFDEGTGVYELTIYYRAFEVENLLQKIRLLGRRVIIKEPAHLRIRLMETANRALARYQE